MPAWHGTRQCLLRHPVTLSGSAALATCLRDKWRNRLVMSDPDALAGEFCLLRITEAGDDGDASAIISAVRGG